MKLFFETRSHYDVQAGLKTLNSSNPPPLSSCIIGTTGGCIWLKLFLKVMETFLGHVQATDESFRGTGFHYTVFDFWHFFFPLHTLNINHSYLKSLAL
jgi:hypothetical protein